jgi:hypothetical protein
VLKLASAAASSAGTGPRLLRRPHTCAARDEPSINALGAAVTTHPHPCGDVADCTPGRAKALPLLRQPRRAEAWTGGLLGRARACGENRGATVIDQLRGIFRQPEIIIGTWRAARAERDDIAEDEAREALLELDPLWDELFPAEQARIVQLLVERVDVRMHGAEVRLRPNGLSGLAREIAGSRRAAA